MLFTLFTLIYAILSAYLLGVATVFAILVWLYDRQHLDEAWQTDNAGKVFLVRCLMWLPLLGAGLMAWKVVENLMDLNLL